MQNLTWHSQLNRDICKGDYVVWDRQQCGEFRVRERIMTFSGLDAVREYNSKLGVTECEIATASKYRTRHRRHVRF